MSQQPKPTPTPPVSEQKPVLPVWSCAVEGGDQLTVGATFSLGCSGESQPLQQENLRIVAGEKNQYAIKILKIESMDDRHFKAVVTSYTPGKYEADSAFTLTDGTKSLQLSGIKFEVASVLPPNEQAQPVPAFGPWWLSFPIWFWILLAVLIIGPIAGVYFTVKKSMQRRRVREELQKHRTARLPFDEFHRELRILEKQHGIEPENPRAYIGDLEKTFRMYLVRELVIPAQQWSERAILGELKKKHRDIFVESGDGLKKLLQEFSRATKSERVTVLDCKQLTDMSREVSESVFKVVSSKAKRAHL